MKLYAHCTHCQEKHTFRKHYATRVEFKMYEGEWYTARCKLCRKEFSEHVSAIRAGHSVIIYGVVVLLCILLTLFTYYRVHHYTPDFTPAPNKRTWWMLLLFPLLGLLIYRSFENSAIRTFNNS